MVSDVYNIVAGLSALYAFQAISTAMLCLIYLHLKNGGK